MENVAISNNNKTKKPMSQALKDAQKRYYEKNKQLIMEKRKEYDKTHPEIVKKRVKTYYEKNRDDIMNYKTEYRRKQKLDVE